VLKRRWDLGLQAGALFPGDHTPYELLPPGPEAGTLTGQVVATLPSPIAERAIFETQAKAVARARNFIYIEDQYFRAPILDELIVKRMEENPDVHLVVVTKPVSAADGGKKWTWLSDQAYRTRFPDRYLLLQLKTFDIEAGVPYFVPIDTHSKITIVDDDYVTAGSANKNNRGYLYEGELNAAVWDVGFGREARTRVLRNLVGTREAEITPDADGAALFAVLKSLSEENAAAEAALLEDADAAARPVGFVYPLEITEDYAVDVGPDVF
jgi:phospholipase D1/2